MRSTTSVISSVFQGRQDALPVDSAHSLPSLLWSLDCATPRTEGPKVPEGPNHCPFRSSLSTSFYPNRLPVLHVTPDTASPVTFGMTVAVSPAYTHVSCRWKTPCWNYEYKRCHPLFLPNTTVESEYKRSRSPLANLWFSLLREKKFGSLDK